MAVSSVYYLHGILLPSGSLISELTDTSPASNTELLTGYSAGHAYPLFRGVRNQVPDASFECNAVGQVLAAIVAGGNNYALNLSNGNTDLEYRRGQDLGIRYSTGAAQNEILRLAKGFLLWNTIAATHQQDATIACRLIGAYDGTNTPIVQVGTGTLTGTPAATQFYTLGPISINGVALANEQSVSIASGVATDELGAAGESWPSYIGVKTVDPIVTITVLGKPWGNYNVTGTAVTALTMYLRAKDSDGYNIANGTASHIKITATNGILVPTTVTGGNNDPAITTLTISLRAADGASNIFTINTASAIT